ncbi:MAG: hypothetical protein QF886_05185 [Planctomycetota bacterium]|nr:hypothetical protein [Planctomycetota bacterium]
MSWFHFPLPSVDNIKIKNVWATNVVNNDVTQASQQKGKDGGGWWWGGGGVSNTVSQTASNVQQQNDAFNNINVGTHAKKSNVTIKNVGASNIVNNTLVQANDQKGTNWGWGGVTNGAWQSSTNNQNYNDAFNNINVWA